MKLAIVFWSGTGNTEIMANCIAEGAKVSGAEAVLLSPEGFDADAMSNYDVVAFGCPSMGAEQLEEEVVEPMFTALEGSLSGKKIALFGSYGWGDGEWMRDWCQRSIDAGAALYDGEGLILNETPDEDGQELCRKLGAGLAQW